MAGTLPHAVFVETGIDDAGTVAAYAAELPGCAAFAASDEAATAAIPRRVATFTAWLRDRGEEAPSFVGDNWYEVERATAARDGGSVRRATFSLDELPPTAAELAAYLSWLELAREELADALDRAGVPPVAAMEAIAAQDEGFVRELGAAVPAVAPDPTDRLYAARDRLTEALERAGAAHDGVRRIFRLAIADDLRLADGLREDEG